MLAWFALKGHAGCTSIHKDGNLGPLPGPVFAGTPLPSGSLSVCLSFTRTPVIEFRTHPIPVRPHFNLSNYICKEVSPVSKWGDILRFQVSMNFVGNTFQPRAASLQVGECYIMLGGQSRTQRRMLILWPQLWPQHEQPDWRTGTWGTEGLETKIPRGKKRELVDYSCQGW